MGRQPSDIDKGGGEQGKRDSSIVAQMAALKAGPDAIPAEFLSCCFEISGIINNERLAQGKQVFGDNERVVLINEMYRTYLEFQGRTRKDGSGYFLSHLCGTVKYLVQMEGLVGLPTIVAAFKHDNLEDLIDESLIRDEEEKAEATFRVDSKWCDEKGGKKRKQFIDEAKQKARKREEKRLAKQLIDPSDYRDKLSGNVTQDQLGELVSAVKTIVEGVTKFRKAESEEGTAEATFKRLLQVALEAIRTIFVKLADRAHNVETISAHGRDSQERIMAETETQYLALARILRIRKMGQFYVEKCCKFSNIDLHEKFDELADGRRKRLVSNKRREILKFFKRRSLKVDACGVAGVEFVNLELADYVAMVDKPFKDMELKDLPIGPFDPMEEILVTVSLYNPKSRLFALSQLATRIEQKFVSTDKSQIERKIAPVGDTDNALGMKVVCYNPKFGHLRFRINDKVSEARSKRGVLAEAAFQQTPEDVQEMIRAVLGRMGSFHGIKGVKQAAQAELLRPRISVMTPKGDVYSLPSGSTGLDFASAIHGTLVSRMSGLLMLPSLTSMEPAKEVDPLGPLESGKVYIVQTDRERQLRLEWLLFANTVAASAIRSNLSRASDKDGSGGEKYLERLSEIFNVSVDELKAILGRKYHAKAVDQILKDIGAGVINPVFALAEYIEFRNNRWRNNIKRWKCWRDLREEGVSEENITAEIVRNLEGIEKWEVEVCVPEAAGSLSDFSAEFSRDVGIKIHQIRSHVPGQGNMPGKLKLLFDLEDNGISVYVFFVKLVKMNFKYPVKVTKPIFKAFQQFKAATNDEAQSEMSGQDDVEPEAD